MRHLRQLRFFEAAKMQELSQLSQLSHTKNFVNCRRIESDSIKISFISWVYATIYVVILDFSPTITLRRSKQYTNNLKF
jgi:hypothetical protein